MILPCGSIRLEFRKGQAEIFKDDQRIAVIDASGFTPNMGFFTEQFLPERIPLPTEEIAYLKVKDDGDLLVQTTRQSSGNFKVETLQGQPLQLFVPALQGNQPDVPNVDVTLTDLIVDPSTGNYISGSVQATVPDQNSTFDLESHGIPISLNEIIYTTQTIDGNPFDALFLNGDLTLLDHQFQNGGDATVFIKSNGRAEGTVNMPDLDAQVPLEPNSNRVVLRVDSLGGNIDVPLTSGGQPNFQFDLTGGFQVNDLSGDPLADVGVDVLFSDQGFSVTDFDASALTDDATINLSHFSFTIDQISSLSMNYSDASGFSYFADLDFTLGVQLASGESIEVPLKNVDLRDGDGIVIPAQQINGGSTPALNAPEFDLGIFRLQPLAFRMDKNTIDVHNLSASDVLDLLPEMDLELTFPSFSGSAPEMTQQSLTLSNIGFDNGILSGSMEPYTVPNDPIHIPIGPAGLYIDQFSGGLFETDDNQQGVNVEVSGYFGMPDMFAGSGEYCEDTRVDLNLNSEGGFEGTVQDFLPCGEIERGPLTMWFGSSELDLSFSNDEQNATIDGTGNAEIERENQNPISASGSLMFDLMEGEILSGSLSLNGPFSWNLPADDPLFVLTVQSALLNSSGLVFTGSGDLEVGDGSVTTTFNDFALSLQDGSIVGGSLEILSQFAIDVSFNPTDWQIADPDDDVNFLAGARFVMPPNLVIDQNGLTADGESSASLIYGEESYVGLNLDFLNMTLGVQPVGVTSGRADLILEEDGSSTLLGYYDSSGFNPENLAGAVPMPDTLGLPTQDVAYIVLKNDEGQNLVQSQSVSNGLELYTAENESVPLVLAGIEDSQGKSPQVDISFSNVVIDNSYKVISGSITADVSQTPLNLSDYGNYPLGLTALRYQKLQNQPHKLYADAKLSLPESIQDLEVIVEDIILGPGGFTEASFSAGTYTTAHTEGDAEVVARHEFSDGAFSLAVRGVNLNFGDSPSYQFSGDMRSGFLTDADGDTSNVHFAADFTNGSWGFALDTNHLTPHELPIGQAKLILDSIGTEFSQSDFNLVLDGRFAMNELAGEDLEIAIEGLRVGTSGVSVDEVDTGQNHSLSMFGQTDNFMINDLGLDITSENHLLLTMGGSLSFAERSFDFSDFRIGTDGTFELGGGNANLIDPSNPVQLMQEYLVLNSLQIGIQNNNATLTASGEATLPDPIGSSSNIDISVDQDGNASINGPDFVLQNATADLGDFATFDLKGAGLQITDIHQGQMTLYASADLDIDGDVIEFGQPGSPQTYGIRYRMAQQKLEWNITNSPSFTFDAGVFGMTISNASLIDPSADTLGVSIDANANFQLEGIGGAGLDLKDFQISKEGIASMGQVDGGSFSIANTVSIEVGSFEWGRDEEITIMEQAGSKENPDSTKTNIQVDEYLRFGDDGNDAVNITIPGGFEGGIEEIFYYRNSNSLYLNIEGVNIELGSTARLFASLEYEKQSDGFLLRVAGGGEIESPSGQSYGLAALGEMSTLNNEFSFGIFVAVQAEIPLFPGVVNITEVGGGFFYNAENEDFEDVLALTDYELYSDQPPWEDKSGGYDFAIALNAGASLIGQGGMYAIQGRTLMLITDKWIMMDVQGELLNQGDRLEAGVYLQVEWDPRFKIGAGIGVTVDYVGVLTGEMNIDFIAVEDTQNSSDDQLKIIWAINGDGSLDIVGGIAEADASFMINQDGFYVEIMVSQGFDIGIISSKSTWEGAFWWLTQDEQIGAYVEIGFNATLFKVASVGGTLKGALLIDNGYLVYASASAYVNVALVFNGRVGVWLALQDGKIDGGTGSNSEYESRVADAREQAQNMGEQMKEAMDAAEEMQSTPEVLKISEETLAAAGQNLLSSSHLTRSTLLIL
ncbi:MAG: hypothetical protein U5K72_15175 [Balneolaceae bacterium]|nr:hypothetical protein [Balneolaceae bacterium]